MTTGVRKQALRLGRPLAALVGGLAAMLAVGAAPSTASTGTTAARTAAAPTTRLNATERATLTQRTEAGRSAAITGTVVGTDGRPVARACLAAAGPSGVTMMTVPANGRFVLSGLRPGSYTLEYRQCGPASRFGSFASTTHIYAAPGRVATLGRLLLHGTGQPALKPSISAWRQVISNSSATVAKTGRITGLVTGRGKPLDAICVGAYRPNSSQLYTAVTGKNGRYTIRNLPADRYSVFFAISGCGHSGNWLSQLYPHSNFPYVHGVLVRVSSGRTTSGINAKLLLGGEISGTVTSRSGKRLRGICVVANGSLSGSNGVGEYASTGRNGSFHVTALIPGKYTISFNTGCFTSSIYAPQWWKHSSSPSHQAVIKIRSGSQVNGIDAALFVGGTVSGTVRLGSSTGTPLTGICVNASTSSGSFFGFATTGRSGKFEIVGLPSGIVGLQFVPGCGDNGNYVPITKYVRATLGKATSGQTVTMQRGAEMTGTVTDADGNPVGGICLTLAGGNSNELDGLGNIEPTNSHGGYDITELAKGSYTLEYSGGCGNTGSFVPLWFNGQSAPSLANSISLATGQHVALATQQLQPGTTIAGTVTNRSGRKLSNVCVGVATPGGISLGLGLFEQVTFTVNGSFRIANLTPGQYAVDFGCGQGGPYADQWFRAEPTPGSADMVSAAAGQTEKVNAVVQAAGSISGVVTAASGKRLSGVCASAVSTADYTSQYQLIGQTDGQFTTNNRGIYRITGLAAGRYRVQIGACNSGRYAPQWYRGRLNESAATPVVVKTGRTTSGINARLTLGGSISGRVQGATGKPLAGVCVLALDAAAGNEQFGLTGSSGRYSIVGLNTGEYVVYLEQCQGGAALVPVVRVVRVTAPKARGGVNAKLVAGGSVAGTVTLAAPASPAAQVCVEVVSANPLNAGGFAVTGNDGTYLASGLAPGTYTVFFNDQTCPFPAADYAPQWYDNQSSQATATTITVTANHTTSGIGAVLQPDGGISGTVSGPGAAAVTGVCVTAVPMTAGSAPVIAISQGGNYSLVDLLPGKYKVEFASGCGATGYHTQWWQDASSAAAATVLTVVADQTIPNISATLAK